MVYEIIQIPESFPSQKKKSLNAKDFKLHALYNPPDSPTTKWKL